MVPVELIRTGMKSRIVLPRLGRQLAMRQQPSRQEQRWSIASGLHGRCSWCLRWRYFGRSCRSCPRKLQTFQRLWKRRNCHLMGNDGLAGASHVNLQREAVEHHHGADRARKFGSYGRLASTLMCLSQKVWLSMRRSMRRSNEHELFFIAGTVTQ